MKLFALLTCDSVNIDQASGKHFIFGHFSSIKVASFPATHRSLTLFVGLSDIPTGEHMLMIKFGCPEAPLRETKKGFGWGRAPVDPMQVILTQNINSLGMDQRMYLISEVKDLYLEKAGNYLISVVIDGDEVGSVNLQVN